MKNMTINFLGDSITAGAGAQTVENMFVNIVEKRLKIKGNNYGICGTRIAKQRTPSVDPSFDEDFLTRAIKMDKTADFVFVFGGTNDYGHGDAGLGMLGNKDPYSFYGALANLLEYLLSVYGREKLCFILPLHRINEDNIYGEGNKKIPSASLSEYVAAIKETLDFYKIENLDLRDIFSLSALDDLTADGLHPNPKGNLIIADAVCKYLIKRKIGNIPYDFEGEHNEL